MRIRHELHAASSDRFAFHYTVLHCLSRHRTTLRYIAANGIIHKHGLNLGLLGDYVLLLESLSCLACRR